MNESPDESGSEPFFLGYDKGLSQKTNYGGCVSTGSTTKALETTTFSVIGHFDRLNDRKNRTY